MFSRNYLPLPGSDIPRIKGDKLLGPTAESDIIRFFVYIRCKPDDPGASQINYSGIDLFKRLPPLTASKEDFEAVIKWAMKCNFKRELPDSAGWGKSDDWKNGQDEFEMASRKVCFSAKVGDINQGLKIKLVQKSSHDLQFRTFAGAIKVPETLSGIILNVTGLDQTPSDGSHNSLEIVNFDREKMEDKLVKNLQKKLKSDPLFSDHSEFLQQFIDLITPDQSSGTGEPVVPPKFGDFLTELRKNFPGSALELFHSKNLQKKLIDVGLPFKYAHLATEITDFYNYPKDYTGKGQTIGIISLDGGWRDGDLKKFFRDHNISPTLEDGTEKVVVYSVDGGNGEYKEGDKYETFNLENTLDISIAAAAAPEARIVVYCANDGLGPRFYESFIQAVSAAVHDDLHKPGVISMSFSDTELAWDAQHVRRLNELFFEGSQKGITFCASAGNYGSKGSSDPIQRETEVRFPGSSPYVVCCGGIATFSHGLPGSATLLGERILNDPTYSLEESTHPMAGGGGYSRLFVQPKWQKGKDLPRSVNGSSQFPMRAVPDVASNAAMHTGYPIYLNGDLYPVPVGGTSSSAPMWAGFFTRVNQARWERGKEIFKLSGNENILKKFNFNLGLVLPRLYRKLDEKREIGFIDITHGNNLYPGLEKHQKYTARPGKWDCCSGFGRPDASLLMQYLMEDLEKYASEFDGLELLGNKIERPSGIGLSKLKSRLKNLTPEEVVETASELKDYIATKVFLQVHNPDKDLIPTAFANKIIKKYALISLGIGLLPLPIVDLAAITAFQVKMVQDLAALYKLEFKPDRTRAIIASLIGSTGALALGVPLISSMAKFIPFVGGLVGAGSLSLSAGAATYAVGKVFSNHFAYGGTFLNFNPNYAFDVFKEENKKGKSILSKISAKFY